MFQTSDWEYVARIYQEGIDTSMAIFEDWAPNWSTWNSKFLSKCRLVATIQDKIVGWAGLQPVSKREAYSGVAEETVYIDKDHFGEGIGTLLLKKLIDESEKAGFWMLTASIFTSNQISIQLHLKWDLK